MRIKQNNLSSSSSSSSPFSSSPNSFFRPPPFNPHSPYQEDKEINYNNRFNNNNIYNNNKNNINNNNSDQNTKGNYCNNIKSIYNNINNDRGSNKTKYLINELIIKTSNKNKYLGDNFNSIEISEKVNNVITDDKTTKSENNINKNNKKNERINNSCGNKNNKNYNVSTPWPKEEELCTTKSMIALKNVHKKSSEQSIKNKNDECFKYDKERKLSDNGKERDKDAGRNKRDEEDDREDVKGIYHLKSDNYTDSVDSMKKYDFSYDSDDFDNDDCVSRGSDDDNDAMILEKRKIDKINNIFDKHEEKINIKKRNINNSDKKDGFYQSKYASKETESEGKTIKSIFMSKNSFYRLRKGKHTKRALLATSGIVCFPALLLCFCVRPDVCLGGKDDEDEKDYDDDNEEEEEEEDNDINKFNM